MVTSNLKIDFNTMPMIPRREKKKKTWDGGSEVTSLCKQLVAGSSPAG